MRSVECWNRLRDVGGWGGWSEFGLIVGHVSWCSVLKSACWVAGVGLLIGME